MGEKGDGQTKCLSLAHTSSGTAWLTYMPTPGFFFFDLTCINTEAVGHGRYCT